MPNTNTNASEQDAVRIYAPDTALKEKLGPNMSFDQVISPRILADAEKVVVESSDSLLTATLAELENLQKITGKLAVGMEGKTALKPIIESAFAIKSKAGLCGYPFASLLAKSLHVYCELDSVTQELLTSKSLNIVRAQVSGLRTIFTNKITGDGGRVGEAILAELNKLNQDS